MKTLELLKHFKFVYLSVTDVRVPIRHEPPCGPVP